MRTAILILLIAAISASCNKTTSEGDSAAKQRSAEFLTSIEKQKYKLAAFYSDKPIDYITTDSEVRAETDLWAYVKLHVLDDENYFAPGGALTVYQKTEKFPGNDSEQISASYGSAARGSDVIFNFVDYIYLPTEYKLHEFDNTNFTVYVDGPSGSRLYSKFARIQ
jgi:hypothetical protein